MDPLSENNYVHSSTPRNTFVNSNKICQEVWFNYDSRPSDSWDPATAQARHTGSTWVEFLGRRLLCFYWTLGENLWVLALNLQKGFKRSYLSKIFLSDHYLTVTEVISPPRPASNKILYFPFQSATLEPTWKLSRISQQSAAGILFFTTGGIQKGLAPWCDILSAYWKGWQLTPFVIRGRESYGLFRPSTTSISFDCFGAWSRRNSSVLLQSSISRGLHSAIQPKTQKAPNQCTVFQQPAAWFSPRVDDYVWATASTFLQYGILLFHRKLKVATKA